MPGKGTQHQSPLIVQLVKNGEEQLAAELKKIQRWVTTVYSSSPGDRRKRSTSSR